MRVQRQVGVHGAQRDADVRVGLFAGIDRDVTSRRSGWPSANRAELVDQVQAAVGFGTATEALVVSRPSWVDVGLERVERGRDRGVDLVRAGQAREAAQQAKPAGGRVGRGIARGRQWAVPAARLAATSSIWS